MIRISDPNGGDLGLTDIMTPLKNLPEVLQLVIQLLKCHRDEIPNGKILSYCITLYHTHKEVVKAILTYIKYIDLPEGVGLYEVDENSVFDIRSAQGSISNKVCFYLIAKP